MENINELISESKSLLSALHSTEKEDKKISNQDELRQEISTFIVSQMSNIKHQDTLKSLIESEFINAILLHEVSLEQMQSWYTTISNEKSKNINVLLDLFKPTQQNALMTPPTKEEDTENLNLTSEQRNALDKLIRVIEMGKKEKTDEI